VTKKSLKNRLAMSGSKHVDRSRIRQ